MDVWAQMINWAVSVDGENGVYKTHILPKPENWVFYHGFVYYEGKLPPIVIYNYCSAKGRIDRSKKQRQNGYIIRVKGKYEDAEIVLQKLESYFEPIDLNNPFKFPDLSNWIDRLKYIVHGIKTDQKKNKIKK